MADALSKPIKMITVNVNGIQINKGSGPYYGEINPSFPSDFYSIIGYCFNNGWDERVRIYVRNKGIGFAHDTVYTLPNYNITIFYI